MEKANENIVTLIKPIKRGEQVISDVTLLKPCAGTFAVSARHLSQILTSTR